MNNNGGAFLMMEEIKSPFYLVFIGFICAIILIGLTFFLNRTIEDDSIQFELARSYYLNKLAEGPLIDKGNLNEFGVNDPPNFAARLQIGDEEYFSNENLYTDKSLCKFETLINCSPVYEDYFVVGGKLKNVKLDLVMKENE